MRSGTIALTQYGTAILLVFIIAWHLAVRIPWVQGVESFKDTMSQDLLYDEITRFWPLLLLLSIAVILHGVNGVRGMLLEWVSDEKLRRVINILAVLTIIVLLVVAIHTIIGISPPQ